MDTLYTGTSARHLSQREADPEREATFFESLMGATVFFAVAGVLIWLMVHFFQIPYVYHSVSEGKITAVKSANGEGLPLHPLPDKYEIIYIK